MIEISPFADTTAGAGGWYTQEAWAQADVPDRSPPVCDGEKAGRRQAREAAAGFPLGLAHQYCRLSCLWAWRT